MDAEEFDAFYSGSVRRLTGQMYAVTGDLGDAQDLVHEAFARAWDQRRRFAEVNNREAWIFTVAASVGDQPLASLTGRTAGAAQARAGAARASAE